MSFNGFKNNEEEEEEVLKVRGLPWSATVEEVVKFFEGSVTVRNLKDGVHMILSRDGRPSGEAYVEVDSPEDIEAGLKQHNQNMGHRYIEVFRAKRSEMEWMMKRGGVVCDSESGETAGCVRLRGLPFECSKEEIAQFFSGLQIVPNGITILMDFQGRNTGEAYVEFANKDMADEALRKHKEKIGHRYIEIFRSSTSEVRAAQNNMKMRNETMGFGRPGPYDRFGPGSRGFGGPPGRGAGFRRNRALRSAASDDYYQDYRPYNLYEEGPFLPKVKIWKDLFNPNQDLDRAEDRRDYYSSMEEYPNSPYGDYGDYGPGPGPRGGPNFGPGGPMRGRFGGSTGHRIHMRGLPFRANEQDIADFFRPMTPVNIKVIYERNGRASGEADVDFATHEEAIRGMKKDKNTMQHRYIELFLDSTPGGNLGPPGGPMGYGGRW